MSTLPFGPFGSRGRSRCGAGLVSATLLLLLVGSADALAQQGGGRRPGGEAAAAGTIRGIVVEADGGKPVQGAAVAVRRLPDSVLVTGAITRADGIFTVTGLRPGRYIARVSSIGYTPRILPAISLAPGADSVDLGQVTLEGSSVDLDEVVVNARRDFMTVTADRTVYSTKDLLVSSGGTATDVLKNIPSVEVDANNNVSLRGNQNVAIQINGRPSMLTPDALASLPADAIERVEIIGNPSAKFDPEGIGGIINIELKQDRDRPLAGGVSGGAGTNGSLSLNGYLTGSTGPLSYSANYGLMRWVRDGSGFRNQENRLSSPATLLSSVDTNDGSSLNNSFNGSLDYALDRQNTISFTTIFGVRGGDNSGVTRYTMSDITGSAIDRSLQTADGTSSDFSHDQRLAYRWVGTPREHELAAEVRYSYEHDKDDDGTSEQRLPLDGGSPGDMLSGLRNRLEERNSDYALQLDYVRPLWSGSRLEAGYKGTLRTIDNDFTSDTLDLTLDAYRPATTNAFTFDETIHAVYGTVSQELGKVSVQLGLRAESATTKFNVISDRSYDNDYTSLFPSANIAYQPTDETQIRLSYGKRVNRPRTRQLNPFTTDNNREFRRVGNPYLLPEYSHNVELNISHFVPWGTISINPYFRRTVDAIDRVERFDSSGVLTSTFGNLGRLDSYGSEFSATARVGDWLMAVGNVSLFKMIADASNTETGFNGTDLGWSARMNATVSPGWGLDIQGSVFYRPAGNIVGGRMNAHVFSDIAVQKRLLDDRARIGIRVNDPFDQAGFGYTRDTGGYRIEAERRWMSRSAMLTFSYTFGKPERNRQRERQQQPSGDEDMGGW